ncbi:MAG: single-stranded-DNA-specific exonuclease RecJ [Candidatus Binatia bacterium]
MKKRWKLWETDEGLLLSLSKALKISPLLARILVHRGMTEPQVARRFLSSSLRSDLPSPALMAGMEQAVNRLVLSLQGKDLIGIWGDYDVDGTTGAAILVSFLREMGTDPLYYIPHRIDEGYGLNIEGLRQFNTRGVRLVITVDCGISNAQEVRFARELGIDVVIVDHHEPPQETPPAVAILNPHRHDCPFPDKGLSGAGLAFYLVIGLRAKLREIGWFTRSTTPDIRRYLDIVTLGTIADMVPLKGINRTLTRRGLTELSSSTRPGILALKQVAGIPPGEVTAGQVGFRLGPRINAAGRMDAGLKVVEMLTTESNEVALRVAQELDEHNQERRAREAQMLEEALFALGAENDGRGRYSIVLAREGWHPGVLGIVASRLVERYHRPTVVIGFHNGEGKGSARSIPGFHLVEGFHRCSDLLEKFGGHEYAGGLTIKREKLASFAKRFEEITREFLTPEDLVPVLKVDALLDFSEIGRPLARDIRLLQPFGIGNPEPIFMTGAVEIAGRKVFSTGSRFRLCQRGRCLNAVAFGPEYGIAESNPKESNPSKSETLNSKLALGTKVDVVYRLSENEWNGTTSVELRIMELRPSTGP